MLLKYFIYHWFPVRRQQECICLMPVVFKMEMFSRYLFPVSYEMEIGGKDSKKCCLDLNLWKQLGDCFVPGTNVSRGLKTEEFCITQFFPPPPHLHGHLEKCRIKCTENLQSLMSVNEGQALSSKCGAGSSPNSSSALLHIYIFIFNKD